MRQDFFPVFAAQLALEIIEFRVQLHARLGDAALVALVKLENCRRGWEMHPTLRHAEFEQRGPPCELRTGSAPTHAWATQPTRTTADASERPPMSGTPISARLRWISDFKISITRAVPA